MSPKTQSRSVRTRRMLTAVRRVMPALVVSSLSLLSCTQAAVVRGRVQGLGTVVDNAERSGAIQCAPRELALAKAHLRFAEVDLEQGELSQAEAHLAVADPNANAALAMSPPDKCSGRVEGDKDGDGYIDAQDKCPEVPETWNGFEDEDGCADDPDSDGDGVTDSKDMCLMEPEDIDGYLDEDGCPEPDNDLDGIPDNADKCPKAPEDPDGFEDTDGCPEPDNDNDTVLDVDDQCPNQAGPPGGDKPGCPKKSSLVVVTAKEIRITQQIFFEFNKAIIKPQSFPILDAVRDVLVDNNQITLEIQGHTDNVGQAAYNLKLSQSRADSVRQYLVGKGTPPARLTAKGYGMTQPIVPNNNDANRALNRRVQFIRTESGKP